MADVSDVQTNDIKEIYDGLEALSCKLSLREKVPGKLLIRLARILVRVLY